MMASVQSWLSAWFASMVLQVEASAMEGLVCTWIGNNMASLMGRQAAMPARASTRPFSIRLIFFYRPFGELLQGVPYFSQISRHALILSFVHFLDMSYH